MGSCARSREGSWRLARIAGGRRATRRLCERTASMPLIDRKNAAGKLNPLLPFVGMSETDFRGLVRIFRHHVRNPTPSPRRAAVRNTPISGKWLRSPDDTVGHVPARLNGI